MSNNQQLETLIGSIAPGKVQAWESVLYYFQPLEEFYKDDEVTEIMINRFDEVYIEKGSRMIKTDATFKSEINLQTFIKQVANALDQQVDNYDYPILNARFPDTSRLCCTMPIVSPYGATVTLRKAPKKLLTFSDLVTYGSLTQDMVDFIGERISSEDCMLISGNTGSGKTSILRASLEFVAKDARMVTSEDTQELYVKLVIPNAVCLEAASRKTKEPIKLADLIKLNLRQRPDYPWIGEIRDAEAADALMMLSNTGHRGIAATIHSNSAADAIKRIQYLLSSSGMMDYDLVGKQIMGNMNLFIHAGRNHRTYGRKILEVCYVVGDELKTVFRYNIDKGIHEYLGKP